MEQNKTQSDAGIPSPNTTAMAPGTLFRAGAGKWRVTPGSDVQIKDAGQWTTLYRIYNDGEGSIIVKSGPNQLGTVAAGMACDFVFADKGLSISLASGGSASGSYDFIK